MALHVRTRLVHSEPLSARVGVPVYLKMENEQNSCSFKIRGIGLLCSRAAANGCAKFVCSSGGNAGLAAAYAARQLGLPIKVIVPETTSAVVVEKLKKEGAEVEVIGKVWDEADLRARELASEPGCQYVHPFDDAVIWKGHATMISEVQEQLDGDTPAVIVVSVGGGGLMNGVLEGMQRVGWGNVPLVAMETVGADSLNACVRAGDWVELPDITSVAKCLGAKKVCRRSFDWLREHSIVSCVVSDSEALKACVGFADEYGIYVPPACGAALAAVYGDVLTQLQKEGRLPPTLQGRVVVIVCGGSGIDAHKVEEWRHQLKL